LIKYFKFRVRVFGVYCHFQQFFRLHISQLPDQESLDHCYGLTGETFGYIYHNYQTRKAWTTVMDWPVKPSATYITTTRPGKPGPLLWIDRRNLRLHISQLPDQESLDHCYGLTGETSGRRFESVNLNMWGGNKPTKASDQKSTTLFTHPFIPHWDSVIGDHKFYGWNWIICCKDKGQLVYLIVVINELFSVC
jgi:hypothetical protein